MRKIVVVLSGGMDSTTLLYYLIAQGYEVSSVISFYYGQRHSRELEYAKATIKFLDNSFTKISHKIVTIPFDQLTYKSSLVTRKVDVPNGHYEDENMKQTVVPSRNLIFIAAASALAITEEADLALGVHGGDHDIYPDCREEFIKAAEQAIKVGNWGSESFEILTPFLSSSKADILKYGIEAADSLGIDVKDIYKNTWSCYRGEEKACGKCGTCVERLEAFKENNIVDPIEYL